MTALYRDLNALPYPNFICAVGSILIELDRLYGPADPPQVQELAQATFTAVETFVRGGCLPDKARFGDLTQRWAEPIHTWLDSTSVQLEISPGQVNYWMAMQELTGEMEYEDVRYSAGDRLINAVGFFPVQLGGAFDAWSTDDDEDLPDDSLNMRLIRRCEAAIDYAALSNGQCSPRDTYPHVFGEGRDS